MMAHDTQAAHVPTQMTLNWNPRFRSFFSICDVMLSKPTWLRGKTAFPWFMAMVISEGVIVKDGDV
jgi:hypothetical protein